MELLCVEVIMKRKELLGLIDEENDKNLENTEKDKNVKQNSEILSYINHFYHM